MPSDYKPESTDIRSDRSGKTLCLKILKKDAVPSNFPIFLTTIQKASSKAFLHLNLLLTTP
ncbi:Hypothetical protein FKW44_013421 [Caligus rogercresseyi]|uniref:Uncharacterized protein n=1 Tax=Caligus rogercresseyi TaxID=217165 RepID=A0A7T8KB85_CALRO|nr:Hypothetical protein FKW44_013421 [Caligus rogercresseyi]